MSSAFQSLPMNETESVNIESAVVVRRLSKMLPARMLSERIKYWPELADILIKEIEGDILVLIGCDVPETRWIMEQRPDERMNPYTVRTMLGWVVFGPSGYVRGARSVNCASTRDVGLTEQLARMCGIDLTDIQS